MNRLFKIRIRWGFDGDPQTGSRPEATTGSGRIDEQRLDHVEALDHAAEQQRPLGHLLTVAGVSQEEDQAPAGHVTVSSTTAHAPDAHVALGGRTVHLQPDAVVQHGRHERLEHGVRHLDAHHAIRFALFIQSHLNHLSKSHPCESNWMTSLYGDWCIRKRIFKFRSIINWSIDKDWQSIV